MSVPTPTAVAAALPARILTASLLIPILLGTIWLGSPILVAVLFVLVLGLAAFEWGALAGLTRAQRWLYAGVLVATASAAAAMLSPTTIRAVLDCAAVFWLGAVFLVGWVQSGRTLPTNANWLVSVVGALVLVAVYLALLQLLAHSRTLLTVLFLLIWCADSAAFFAGRAWGKTKLAHRVSPGKTWVGVGAALVSGLAVGAVLVVLEDLPPLPVLGIALLTVSASIVGDLLESLLKRREGLKDSGTLLPGHGGVLDRIDSLLAGAPVFALTIGLVTPSS